MSLDYAAGLSDYDDLGVCGLDEVYDKLENVKEKVKFLAELIRQTNGSCVVHVGAGLSTSAGIPDFRGKNGVWTKKLNNVNLVKSSSAASNPSLLDDKKNLDSTAITKPFDDTQPTIAHLALKELCRLEYVKHIVSQNVDGLFLKANLDRNFISELHGNFYLDECTKCRSRYIRNTATKSMKLQRSTVRCPRAMPKTCNGYIRDTILDWESPIPYDELRKAERESKRAKLHICVGTTLQLRPSKDLVCDPTLNKSTKLVIINLQPTLFDQKASLKINYYADDVMKLLATELDIEIPTYNCDEDPTKQPTQGLVGRMWKRS